MSRVGVAGVVAVFAAGVWLVAAPFALGYQAGGRGWTGATKTDVIPAACWRGRIRRAVLAVTAWFAGCRAACMLMRDSAASLAGTADRGNSGS